MNRIRLIDCNSLTLQQLLQILPQIVIVDFAAEHAIFFDNSKLLRCQSLRQLALLAAGSINIKGQAQLLQQADAALQERCIQTCTHPFHNDQLRAGKLLLPFIIPNRRIGNPTAGAGIIQLALLLQLFHSLLHHTHAANNIRQENNLHNFYLILKELLLHSAQQIQEIRRT